MDCNNTLTDAKLEAIFAVTDEEIRQIEQPMECPIERTQHKYKNPIPLQRSCTQAEPLWTFIKKGKCLHCGRAINCTNNLENHLRRCEKAPKRQLHQTTLNGPTSSTNVPSAPKKLMVEEVQVGGASTDHVEQWKVPERLESALKYTALIFRKTFDNNSKRDALQRLEDVFYTMKPVIEEQTRANVEADKWYLSLNISFWSPQTLASRRIRLLHSGQRFSSPLTPTKSITNFTKSITKLCSRSINFNTVVVVGS